MRSCAPRPRSSGYASSGARRRPCSPKSRKSLTAIERAARETESKLAAVAGARARAEEDFTVAKELEAEAEAALAAFAAGDDPEPALVQAQGQVEKLRGALTEAQAAILNLERERRARTERRSAIAIERERWTTRSAGAGQQIDTLKARLAETRGELEELGRHAGAHRGAQGQAAHRLE